MTSFRLPTSDFRLPTALLCLILAGCPKPAVDEPVDEPDPLAGATLRLLVVGDEALAKAAEQARGEWNAQTGSELLVERIDEQAMADAKTFEADAVICPSHQLGPLAERELIVPVPEKIASVKSQGWADVFELVRHCEVVWGQSVRAVPFGSPVLVCYYRADLLEKLGRQPPETWAEYGELAQLLADRKKLGDLAVPHDRPWHGAIEPLADGWAGLTLLARAAPYAKHPSNYSTLFDIETMEPLVDGPPLVRALEELVAVAKLAPADALKCDPAAARALFWQGRCGLALSWPSSTATVADDVDSSTVPAGLAELPGSVEVYNREEHRWQTRGEADDPRVPLLGISGRIGLVGRASEHPQAAFQLLRWMSEDLSAGQFSATSPATTLFRRSQVKSARAWVERPIASETASRYAEGLQQTLRRPQWLFGLRIPGRREYLAALDRAVHAAISGEQPPADALRAAAGQWRKISEKRGLERQKTAYLHGLGLEP